LYTTKKAEIPTRRKLRPPPHPHYFLIFHSFQLSSPWLHTSDFVTVLALVSHGFATSFTFGFSGCTKTTSVLAQLRFSSPGPTRLNLAGSVSIIGRTRGELDRVLELSSLFVVLLHSLRASRSGAILSRPPVALLVSLASSCCSSSDSCPFLRLVVVEPHSEV